MNKYLLSTVFTLWLVMSVASKTKDFLIVKPKSNVKTIAQQLNCTEQQLENLFPDQHIVKCSIDISFKVFDRDDILFYEVVSYNYLNPITTTTENKEHSFVYPTPLPVQAIKNNKKINEH